VLTVVELTLNPLDDRHLIPATLVLGLGYLTDIPLGVDASPAIGHLWTLSIEEQFYLVWPFLLLLAIRWRQVGTVLLAAGVGLILLCALSLVIARDEVAKVYMLPTSWAVTLVIGGAAYIYRERLTRSFLASRAAASAAVVILVASTFPELKHIAATYVLGGPLIAVCAVALIFQAEKWHVVGPALEPLRALGLVSYAAYLWNYPIAEWLSDGDGLSGWRSLASFPLTIAAAIISWFALEKPAQRLRQRIESRSGSSAQDDRGRADVGGEGVAGEGRLGGRPG
jgi:peptidoglycan/LPS O-acetylase OafA/YrhL